MNNNCEIRIYDKDFNWLNVATLAESVQLERDIYGVGKFEIHIHPDKTGAYDLAKRGNIIVINGNGHKSGIVRDFYLNESRSGTELVIYGSSGAGLTGQRIIVPPTKAEDAAAYGWERITGSAEAVLKHFVTLNMTNPKDIKRKFDNIIVAASLNRGQVFPWRARYTKLSEELNAIALHSEMGFEMYADLAAKRWIFDVIPGTDRSVSQSAVSPVTFKMEYQNIEDYKYTEDYQKYANTGYSGGQGEDENRLIYTLGAANTGHERWEVFLDCASAKDITELQYYGEQKLSEFKEVKNIEASALPKVFIFEKDYDIGDKVTLYLSRLDLKIDTKITSVKEIWERPTGYKTQIRFGEKAPNIFTVLRQRKEVR